MHDTDQNSTSKLHIGGALGKHYNDYVNQDNIAVSMPYEGRNGGHYINKIGDSSKKNLYN